MCFEIMCLQIEDDLVTLKKKNEVLDNNLKEFAEKLAFKEANFSQRVGDLAVSITSFAIVLMFSSQKNEHFHKNQLQLCVYNMFYKPLKTVVDGICVSELLIWEVLV